MNPRYPIPTLPQRYVAVLKWLLEWTKVAAAAERPVGVLFWKVADGMSNWMARTLLPPPDFSTKPGDESPSTFDVEGGRRHLGGGQEAGRSEGESQGGG